MQPKNATINNLVLNAGRLRHLSFEKRHSPRMVTIDSRSGEVTRRYTMPGESVATFVWSQPDALRYN
jgi:hypothetical protein